jgi:uncharacterized protein with FMN-binding domain
MAGALAAAGCLLASTIAACAAAAGGPRPAPAAANDPVPAAFQKKAWPAWAKIIKFVPQPGKLWQVTNNSRFSADDMKESVGRLRYQLEQQPRPPEYPYFLFSLGRHCLDLNEDALAYDSLRSLVRIPAATPFRSVTAEFTKLDDVVRESHFLLARLYARNGMKAEALAELRLLPALNGYDSVRHAEVLTLLNDTNAAVAMLEKSNGAGHPDRGFSDIMIRLRAAALARAIDRNDVALKIANPIVAAGENAQKWPQWKSAWTILNELARNAKGGKPSGFQAKKDGAYKGACRGFDNPIEVDVRVMGGKIKSVAVTAQKESRPWSALDTVPNRVVRQQGLRVDAVTGATVTSSAVLTAVDNASQKAAP